MKATMKKRLAKGILAAAFAFVSVLGVPQSAAQNAKRDNMIAAHAARCTHNYRHYAYDYDPWEPAGIGYTYRNGVLVRCPQEKRTVYTKCANCGGDRSHYTQYRNLYIM